MDARDSLKLDAGRNLVVASTTVGGSSQDGPSSHSYTALDRVAGLYVTGSGATVLQATAGQDIQLTAAQVAHAGGAGSTTLLQAGGDLTLDAVRTGRLQSIVWDADNHLKASQSQDVGTTVQAAGDIALKAGGDISGRAATVSSSAGSVTAAGRDVKLAAGESSSFDQAQRHTSSGFLSSTTIASRTTSDQTKAVASELSGRNVDINASRDVAAKGSNVLSDAGTSIMAGRNVDITAVTQNNASSSDYSKRSSGPLGGGGLGFTIGTRSQSSDQKQPGDTAAGSVIGSTGGSVSIHAGQTYTQTGSDVLAPQGDIAIQAKKLDITEAREKRSDSSEQKFSQSGLSVSLGGGIIDTARATVEGIQGLADGGARRSKALNALVAYAKGADLVAQGAAVVNAADRNGVMGTTGADGKAEPGAAAASGIRLSISAGSSRSQSSSSTAADSASGATVKAGGNVRISSAEDSLNVRGSRVEAGRDVELDGVMDVNVIASSSAESTRAGNSSSAASIGGSVGIGSGGAGLSVDVAASRGKGQANSDSATYDNSRIVAGNAVRISSGADTNIKGGNVSGRQTVVQSGGSLNVESLQDTATSNASQKNADVSASVPVAGSGGSANLSLASQKSSSSYASVHEQSGIQAGDGGFQIRVQGNTDLKGAVLSSSADAGANRLDTGSLTTGDLENRMSASASSSGISAGTEMLSGKYGLAKGIAGNLLNKGGASTGDVSTTASAISAAKVTVGGKTTDTGSETLLDSDGKTVKTATEDTHRALDKADVVALQDKAQQKQASQQLLINALAVVGDKIYRKETEEKKLIRIQCETANKENCVRQDSVTLDQIKAIKGKITAVNNGMLNSEEQTLIVGYMQSTGIQLQDGVLVVVNPQANDVISEGAWVTWKKIEQVFGFGTSSAGELNLALVAIAASQGAKLDTISHSAGNFAVDEMLRKLQDSGVKDAAVGTVTMFGSPVNAQSTSNRVGEVTNSQGVTQQSTHVNDFVGSLFGGNSPTGGSPEIGSLPSHSSYTGDLTSSESALPQFPNVPSPRAIRNFTDKAWLPNQFSAPLVVPFINGLNRKNFGNKK
ncbi:hemagglutinin repeat-containing protein [Amphibiibacter pelophylacis]|uniref:Hemagglutinin repeat-containing protein n=1 Tax=Amphibiibacter pelophylacis TaxID=1799477 RepID=A0ACC6P4Q7_9BURK